MVEYTNIKDLQAKAKKRMPRMFYDYVDAGSWTESTYNANEKDFQNILLTPRVAKDISKRTIASTMLGEKVTMPCALAPIGLTGMMYADGEIRCAKAAEEFGVPYTLSTMSICSIEQVAKNTTKPFWFQLYVMKDREFSKKLILRAKQAGCSALMITLDLQLLGQRHKDIKNGLSAPPQLKLSSIMDFLFRPAWCLSMLTAQQYQFGNIVGHVEGVKKTKSLSSWVVDQFDLSLNWDDVARLKDIWGGKLIIKGVFSVEDAKHAVKAGADAIVVSNHGGRQLDGACSAISLLPEIVKSVGENTDIWMDGGIRSGQDMLKAIALGAKGTLLGRSYIYGLGALGKKGVSKALQLIQKELDTTMGMCGFCDIKKVDRSMLRYSSF